MSDTHFHNKPKKYVKINRNLVINGLQNSIEKDLNNPNGIHIKIGDTLKKVESIKLINLQIPVPINSKVIMEGKNNNQLTFKMYVSGHMINDRLFDSDIGATITIPDGNYSPIQLRTVIEALIKTECVKITIERFGAINAFDFNCIFIKYNKINNRYFFGSQYPFEIDFSTGELYKLSGFDGRRYVSTAKSKLDLFQLFPHDGTSKTWFDPVTNYVNEYDEMGTFEKTVIGEDGVTTTSTEVAPLYNVVEPPSDRCINLYNYETILLILEYQDKDMNKTILAEQKKSNFPNKKIFAHYTLGTLSTHGIIKSKSDAIKLWPPIELDQLTLKFIYQNGEIVDFGKTNNNLSVAFQFTMLRAEDNFDEIMKKKK